MPERLRIELNIFKSKMICYDSSACHWCPLRLRVSPIRLSLWCVYHGGGGAGEAGNAGRGEGGTVLAAESAYIQQVSLWSCFSQVWWSVTVKARENTVDFAFHPPPSLTPTHPPPSPPYTWAFEQNPGMLWTPHSSNSRGKQGIPSSPDPESKQYLGGGRRCNVAQLRLSASKLGLWSQRSASNKT